MKFFYALSLMLTSCSVLAQYDTLIYSGWDSVITEENATTYVEVSSNKHGIWEKYYTSNDDKWRKRRDHRHYERENDSTLIVTRYLNDGFDEEFKIVSVNNPEGGYILTEYFPSQEIRSITYSELEIPLYKNGLEKKFYASGNLKSECNYVDNNREGDYKEYFKEGGLKVHNVYHKGQMVSARLWFENGEERISDVWDHADAYPEFADGENEMYSYLGKNMKYPPDARDRNIQGRVYVSFVVMEDGSIEEVVILRGIGGGCDEESIQVVEDMPNWTPGTLNGNPIRMRFNLPLVFQLR